jgi:membrane protease YdiL (CAAX protease family)
MWFTWIATAIAAALFIPLFITRGVAWLDFWWWMAANIAILLTGVAVFDKGWRNEVVGDFRNRLPKKIFFGLLSATLLYGVFYVGDIASRHLFSFADRGINDVYNFKTNVPPIRIALLMIFLIGPGEELFWRGFLQRRLQDDYGPWYGFFISAAIYSFVHIGSGNPMLVLAAGVCGFFWGFLYLRYRSLLMNMVSHTVWDLAIFLLFPVG